MVVTGTPMSSPPTLSYFSPEKSPTFADDAQSGGQGGTDRINPPALHKRGVRIRDPC